MPQRPSSSLNLISWMRRASAYHGVLPFPTSFAAWPLHLGFRCKERTCGTFHVHATSSRVWVALKASLVVTSRTHRIFSGKDGDINHLTSTRSSLNPKLSKPYELLWSPVHPSKTLQNLYQTQNNQLPLPGLAYVNSGVSASFNSSKSFLGQGLIV